MSGKMDSKWTLQISTKKKIIIIIIILQKCNDLIRAFLFVSENTRETMLERRKRCWKLEEGGLDSFSVSGRFDSHSIVG
jgi:hypothetical protein